MLADDPQHTKVKICGITNLQDARFVSGAMAHYLGFIFYEDSPRYIDPAEAGAIINWLEGLECVGVFVNQPLDDVNMIARQSGIDMVQLHGNESPEYCKMIDKPVIKAIHVEPDTDASELSEAAEPYFDSVDYLLYDARVDERWGGTGTTFDWNLLQEQTGGIPFFLSGGLNAGNIEEACQMVSPYAVDLSSGVERKPGKKDYDKIEAFMDEMRTIWKKQEVDEL